MAIVAILRITKDVNQQQQGGNVGKKETIIKECLSRTAVMEGLLLADLAGTKTGYGIANSILIELDRQGFRLTWKKTPSKKIELFEIINREMKIRSKFQEG